MAKLKILFKHPHTEEMLISQLSSFLSLAQWPQLTSHPHPIKIMKTILLFAKKKKYTKKKKKKKNHAILILVNC